MQYSRLTQAWTLLLTQQRRQFMSLIALMMIGAILEMAGIGLLLPVLALMTQPDFVAKSPTLAKILGILGNPGQAELIMGAMLALVGVNAIRTGFLALLAWRQSRFIQFLVVSLSERMYAGYLSQPYTFHLQRNSAQLIRNTTGEVAVFAGAVQNVLGLASETMVLVLITALLLLVDPLGVVVVLALLGLAAWWFNQRTRRRISMWGIQREHHEGMRIQHLQQGLGGAKEVKLLGRESFFLGDYNRHNLGSAHANQRHTFVQALPRLWLEFLAILGMGVFVVTVLLRGNPIDAIVPSLGVFAAAAFRLMPSVNRMLGAVQGIRYGMPAIQNLSAEFSTFQTAQLPVVAAQDDIAFNTIIELDQVRFAYPAAHKSALDGMSLTIPKGASVGFIGGSGAGKSTLVDVVLGLLTPTSGAVKVDGVDIQSRLRSWQDQLGYVPQSIYLTDDTLRRNVAFGLPEAEIDESAVLHALRAAQLEEFVSTLPQGLDTLVGERGVRLSGGQRQRIGIARALYYDPPVLVLDEATSALDTATEQGVMAAVNALHGNKTLLIVAHRLSTVAHCDFIFRLEGGHIVESGDASRVLVTVGKPEVLQVES